MICLVWRIADQWDIGATKDCTDHESIWHDSEARPVVGTFRQTSRAVHGARARVQHA